MPRFSLRSLMIGVLCACLALALIHALLRRRTAIEYSRQQQADMTEIAELKRDLEKIHFRLDRYPNDEAELVMLRGKPMPKTHSQNRLAYAVTYTMDEKDTTYELHYSY